MDKLILLTIIADESLTNVLDQLITDSGAKGFTLTRVEGKGRSGARNNQWVGENVKIETIAPITVVMHILDTIRIELFERYPIIAYYHDVNVVRTEHF